ncbi:MAG: hypothetical protein IJK15_01710 [Bacteroidaceae bacterium]|nr:hypothetical protein [Bacteroidaceae bacterium]
MVASDTSTVASDTSTVAGDTSTVAGDTSTGSQRHVNWKPAAGQLVAGDTSEQRYVQYSIPCQEAVEFCVNPHF